MSDVTIGKIITHDARKDAIHVAIAPCKSHGILKPGEHIGIHDGISTPKDPVGIVDPFLDKPVTRGQTFWIFLYPKTASNLRHEWDHPAFQDDASNVQKIIAKLTGDEFAVSRQWLEDFARKAEIPYKNMIALAGDYCIGDDNGPVELGNKKVELGDQEFWKHYKNLAGVEPNDKQCRGC